MLAKLRVGVASAPRQGGSISVYILAIGQSKLSNRGKSTFSVSQGTYQKIKIDRDS